MQAKVGIACFVVCLCATFMSCSSRPDMRRVTKDGQHFRPQNQRLVLLCTANYFFDRHDEKSHQGVFIGVEHDWQEPLGPEEWNKFLAEANIVSVFRSSREAVVWRDSLLSNGVYNDEVEYYVAQHRCKGWECVRVLECPSDELRFPERDQHSALGSPDAGFVGEYSVVLWPSPLGERGYALALAAPIGNGIVFTMPKDRASSFITTWEGVQLAHASGHPVFRKDCATNELRRVQVEETRDYP